MAAPQYSVYIVKCADGSLYTGIAIDVDKRLAEHAAGTRGAKYLRGKGPLQLAFSVAAGDRSQASRLEYRVKQLSRKDKLALIAGYMNATDLVEDQVLEEGCA